MSTVNDVYLDCCDLLLEPAGLTLNLLSVSQFLQWYRETVDAFMGSSGLIQGICCMPQEFGIPQYTMADWTGEPEAAFSDGSFIRRDFEGNLSSINRNWQNGPAGSPRSWRQDKQLPKQLSAYPPPNVESALAPTYPPPGTYGAVLAWAPGESEADETAYIGTMIQTSGTAAFTSPGTFFGAQPLNQFSRGNMCVIGSVGLLSENITLSSPVEALTDDWLTYIKYGILEKIWMSDSELKDVQRAQYARARYQEGVMLAAAVMGEAIDAE